MALAAGTRLGPYEIVSLLGVGGMGEVYLAHDRKLDRGVAIKILLAAVANDPDRLARFGREAQVLASLNHPNIAHIYGLEDADGVRALVMELVEGPTLADRIAASRIPIEEALPIANQIAEALEAAHENGIIHRDLKPANIKVRSDGTVKVLDFGLAKALDPTGSSNSNATISPTISIHATQAGVILGTAAYMAPEQARGRVVDRRADVWAFGCVLYEMLAGARAFKGDDVTDTVVAVVSKEPDWDALPAAASGMRPLLERCLKKDPKQRLQAIGDARIQIEELITGASPKAAANPSVAATRSRRVVPVAVAALAGMGLLGALVTWALMRPAPQTRALVSRFEVVPPPTQALAIQGADRDIAISPDGRYIGYRANAGLAQLVIRAIDQLDAHALTDITNAREPFFSADSRWIGFFDGAGLKKVPTAGGSAVTIWKNYIVPRGASWGDDNYIVFGGNNLASNGLLRVPASGGEPVVLTTPDAAKGEKWHWRPSVLPGARGILFTIAMLNPANPDLVAVLDMKTGQRKTLIRGGTQAEYVQTGHLLYAAAGTLHAVRFDLGRLEVVSDPLPVVDGILMESADAANYVVSPSGTLAYLPATGGRRPRSLVWVDRTGRETPVKAPPRMYDEPRLSPDGTRVALTIYDQESDVWIWDLGRETLTRLTFDPGIDRSPVWTPDGQRIVFASTRAGPENLFMQSADGTGAVERLTTGADWQAAYSVAPDGSGIVGWENSPSTTGDIVWFPLRSPSSQSGSAADSRGDLSRAEPLVRTAAIEHNAAISPDGRYIAYQSNESGRDEIYVRPFPHVNDGRWQLSTSGGTRPAWARSGRELFYVDLGSTLTAVPVRTAGAIFAAGNPAKLFETRYAASLTSPRDYDVAPDGQRFLMMKESVAATPPSIVVVQNWTEELKLHVPAK